MQTMTLQPQPAEPAPEPQPQLAEDLSVALQSAQLSQYETALRELGCTVPADLADLEDEDLMEMDFGSILKLIGRFTGLYAGDDLIDAAEASGRCQPGRGASRAPGAALRSRVSRVASAAAAALAEAGGGTRGKATGKRVGGKGGGAVRSDRRKTPSTYAIISPEERILYNMSKRALAEDREAYDFLFGPYNALLGELVGHADFGWEAVAAPQRDSAGPAPTSRGGAGGHKTALHAEPRGAAIDLSQEDESRLPGA